MENIEKLLKLSICSILASVSEETVNSIICALKDVGVESLSDLPLVQDEDLVSVLKPIQRRRLLKAWNEQGNIAKVACFYCKTSLDADAFSFHEQICLEKPTVCSQCSNVIKLKDRNEHRCDASETEAVPLRLSDDRPYRKGMFKKKNQFRLLQTYINYKTELSTLRINEQKVWQKIASEINRLYSVTCDALQCCSMIGRLKCEYEKIKKTGVVKSQRDVILLNEGKKAFETTENSETETTESERLAEEEKVEQENETEEDDDVRISEEITSKSPENGVKRKVEESEEHAPEVSPKKVKTGEGKKEEEIELENGTEEEDNALEYEGKISVSPEIEIKRKVGESEEYDAEVSPKKTKVEEGKKKEVAVQENRTGKEDGALKSEEKFLKATETRVKQEIGEFEEYSLEACLEKTKVEGKKEEEKMKEKNETEKEDNVPETRVKQKVEEYEAFFPEISPKKAKREKKKQINQ